MAKDSPTQPKRRSRRLQDPRRNRRLFHLLLVFVASAIIVDGMVGDRGLLAMMRARRDYEALSGTIGRLRSENHRLRDEARRLRDDPAAIEEVARRELGLIRPGEKVFIVKDVPPPAATKP